VELTKDDIECILETLIYDAKIERIVKGDAVFYVAVNSFLDTPGLARTPCGICPVFKECTPNGLVNPKSCQYLTKWLNEPMEGVNIEPGPEVT
jgi:DNA-directed RNA polymerase III subunit RPC6